jgi:hypothetical protein
MPDQCALCEQNRDLRESHIIPKFVGRWIKRSSETRKFRAPDAPRRRKQDIYKQPLLCGECEQRFSSVESTFSSEIFRPFLDDGQEMIDYGSWLLEFAVSEAWRVGIVHRTEIASQFHALAADMDLALREWADFLLKKRPDPGSRQHYLLLLSSSSVPATETSPSAYEWFLMRAVDGAPVAKDGELFIYTKLPGLALVSAVTPPAVGVLAGHEIHHTGQTTGIMVLPESLRSFVLQRAEDAMHDLDY